jgi:hypothetical protein
MRSGNFSETIDPTELIRAWNSGKLWNGEYQKNLS